MVRRVQNRKLNTRSARQSLPSRREPYWTKLDRGLSLGYRRTLTKVGTWIARRYDPTAKKRLTYKALGPADDHDEADGRQRLSFYQAQDAARNWNNRYGGSSRRAPGTMTVADACNAYVDYLAAEKAWSVKTRHSLDRHVVRLLGNCRINDLTTKDVEKCRNAMVWKEPDQSIDAATSTNSVARDKSENADPDAVRRSKASANRIMAMLKAALNRAFNDPENGIISDTAWRRVKPFSRVVRARDVHLDHEQCDRLINAATHYIPKQTKQTGMKAIVNPNAFRNLVIATLLRDVLRRKASDERRVNDRDS